MLRALLPAISIVALAAAARSAPGPQAAQGSAQHPRRTRTTAALLATAGQLQPAAQPTAQPGDHYRDPDVWGPPTWFFLHSLTLALPERVPEAEQAHIRQLMQGLQHLLPCPSCGKHLAEHMRELPLEPHLGTRDGMVKWMVDLHNMVNTNCGKRAWSLDEVLRRYDAAYAGGGHSAVIAGGRSGAANRGPPLVAAALAAASAAFALAP